MSDCTSPGATRTQWVLEGTNDQPIFFLLFRSFLINALFFKYNSWDLQNHFCIEVSQYARVSCSQKCVTITMHLCFQENSTRSYIQITLFFRSYFWAVSMNQEEKHNQNIQLYLLFDLHKEAWFSALLLSHLENLSFALINNWARL